MSTKKNRSWTEGDDNEFFAFIGLFVVFFQWIEGKLDQILILSWGNDKLEESHVKLSSMNNYSKIEVVKEVVLTSSNFESIQNWTEWCDHFVDTIERLHKLRILRNSIMHSDLKP